MMPPRRSGVRVPLRERTDLARKAHVLNEQGMMTWEIAIRLHVTEPTAKNLIGYGRRLAAGQGVPMEWDRDGSGSPY